MNHKIIISDASDVVISDCIILMCDQSSQIQLCESGRPAEFSFTWCRNDIYAPHPFIIAVIKILLKLNRLTRPEPQFKYEAKGVKWLH